VEDKTKNDDIFDLDCDF